MTDVENVIYAIERCTCHVPDACRDCPYDAGHPYNECIEMLLKDAMKLLKEQESVEPYIDSFNDSCWWATGCCGTPINFKTDKFCPKCGRKVKWE